MKINFGHLHKHQLRSESLFSFFLISVLVNVTALRCPVNQHSCDIDDVLIRVRDLMRSGVLKPTQKPIWYDVYKAFPPKRPPLHVKPHTRPSTKTQETVPEIFYKEDEVRAYVCSAWFTLCQINCCTWAHLNWWKTPDAVVSCLSELLASVTVFIFQEVLWTVWDWSSASGSRQIKLCF